METSHSIYSSYPCTVSALPLHSGPPLNIFATINQNIALSDSPVDCKIARDTDAGQARFAKFIAYKRSPHLKVSHPDRATALTNLAHTRLQDHICKDLQDIDVITSLFRDALASRPQHHSDHSLSLHNLTEALIWRHKKKGTAADIREAAQLYHEPLCSEGTYLRSIAAGADDVDYVIEECNNVPTDASDEGIHLRKVVLEFCSLGHRLRPGALDCACTTTEAQLDQHGSTDDLDKSIRLDHEAVSPDPRGAC
ncbi:hypothetical protein EDD22DRAFT_958772 [Suillus occidentalis]|nr:hypothetical protein EDD22DRAFT_958772 [Suillus occidentalis]